MKKLLSLFSFLVFTMILLACPVQEIPKPQIPMDTESCEVGCSYLLSLKDERDGHPGCQEARVLELPDGDILTCKQFCEDTQNRGRSLCPSRWKEAKQCGDVEKIRLNCNIGVK